MRVSENNRRKEHCTSAFLLFTKDKSTMSRFIFLRENIRKNFDPPPTFDFGAEIPFLNF